VHAALYHASTGCLAAQLDIPYLCGKILYAVCTEVTSWW